MVTHDTHDVIAVTLFGKARRLILALLYTHTDEMFYLRRIVREAGIGLGPAQRELKQLTNAGIIKRQNKDRLVYYQANPDCPIFSELKNIVLKTAGLVDIIRSALEPLLDRIKAAFIYGSFASGGENRHSDVDLMVVGKVKFADVSSALSSAEDILQREINFAVYSTQEFRQRRMDDDHFIKSVSDNVKLFVIGNEDEFARLVK